MSLQGVLDAFKRRFYERKTQNKVCTVEVAYNDDQSLVPIQNECVYCLYADSSFYQSRLTARSVCIVCLKFIE
jgi:hypothetical protein